MRDTESSISPSHETLETEPEPQPVTTDDDLLKAVERAQTLWTIFADAQVRQASDEMTRAMDELALEYEILADLLDTVPDVIDPNTLELAQEEFSYADLLDKMRHRAGGTSRSHAPASLGNMDHFVL